MAQLLISCAACGGLSPYPATACLHCDGPLARRAWLARLVQLLAGGGFLMTLAACYGVAYRPSGATAGGDVDNDRDRSPVPADCDDVDPSRYPGAEDPDGDGIDQNCDGVDGWRDPTAVIAEPADPAP